MKTNRIEFVAPLSAQTIDLCSDKIGDYLGAVKIDKKEAIRVRMSAESLLLNWQNYFGEEKEISLTCFSFLGQPTIQIKLEGASFDPILSGSSEESEWSRKLLSNVRITPLYSYSKNTNYITFKLEKKRKNPVLWVLLALLSAFVVGVAGLLIPEDIRLFITDNILKPICTTYIKTLNFHGIPLIFLSVVLGVCGISDLSSFGKVGKKMISHYGLALIIITVIASAIAVPFFNFEFGAEGIAFGFTEFLDMFLDFIPYGLFEPFINTNAMQLIIMGFAFGIAIVLLRPNAQGFASSLEGLNSILVLISKWFTRIIPFFTFLIVVKSIWSGEVSKILDAWKPWVIITLLQIVAILAMMVQICIKHKVKFKILLKKILPSFIISFGTGSVNATVPEMFDFADNCGVDINVSLLSIPIGTSIYKPSLAIRFIVISFFVAVTYGVKVSPEWIVLAVLMSIVLSIGAPAIPGGALLFYPMLFLQLGLPSEAITSLLAIDFFFDATCTAFAILGTNLGFVQQAGKLEMLDEKRLRTI